jgi:hypothetical protein
MKKVETEWRKKSEDTKEKGERRQERERRIGTGEIRKSENRREEDERRQERRKAGRQDRQENT